VIPEEQGRQKRYGAIVLAAAIAVGLAGVLVGVIQAAPTFLHLRRNLSNTAYTSVYPDLAVSPDHNWLAAAWVEGYTAESGSRGHVYLRIASESAGWGDPITVYSGGESACAYDRAAVAITGTKAHIAYVVYDDTCANPKHTQVRYITCTLTTGQCGASQLITTTSTTPSPGYWTTWVDLAVDESGNPHVVFARYEGSPLVGKIFYTDYNGATWRASEAVYTTGDNHTPSIAWSENCAHVVWEDRTGSSIRYRRRCGGTWYPTSSPMNLFSSIPSNPPHKPHVAAAPGGRVFVVWDYLYQEATPYSPATYFLLYKRSNASGTVFSSTKEVGTDYESSSFFTPYEAGAPGSDDYLRYLQPSVALNEDGWPAVVWHTGGVTGTYYTYAISGTDSSVKWVPGPLTLVEGQAGAAAVGFGEPISETMPLLHFVYMNAGGTFWDVYYDSNEEHTDIPTVYLPLVMKSE
jgi:hypothetical protein